MTSEALPRRGTAAARPSALHWNDAPRDDFAPELAPGSVHLWRFSLDLEPRSVSRLAAWLSPDEHARADRFVFPVHRRRFIAARGMLRHVLATYLDAPPEHLRFTYGAQGKPELDTPHAVRFNLSHSDSAALLAVALDRPVGVDLERVGPLRDLGSLARQVFTPRELRDLDAVPASDRLHAFYLGWTRKEAFLKAVGDGLSRPLQSFAVELTPGRPACLLEGSGLPGEPDRWSLHDLVPWPGFAACVAIPAGLDETTLVACTASAPDACVRTGSLLQDERMNPCPQT